MSSEIVIQLQSQKYYRPSTPAAAHGGDRVVVTAEEQRRKVRKPYTIKKCRESWTNEEHEKFLEALHLFDRDWKKIEAFVGSKTVLQIRSHAQKYFLKVQKTGSNERVPPPRPKRKAVHPYPQKASKTALDTNQPITVFQPMHVHGWKPSSVLTNQSGSAPTESWSFGSFPVLGSSNVESDDARLVKHSMSNCCSCSNESGGTWPVPNDHIYKAKRLKVMPDFAEVYRFIGNVFDPDMSDHLQKLKMMDPINVETVLLLMRNLSANLLSPEFEEHRKLISSYDIDSRKARSCSPLRLTPDNSKTAIPAI